MKCQVSHYVAYMDEEQTMAYYDYFWCNVHHRKCGSNGCEAVEQGLHQTAGERIEVFRCYECRLELVSEEQ